MNRMNCSNNTLQKEVLQNPPVIVEITVLLQDGLRGPKWIEKVYPLAAAFHITNLQASLLIKKAPVNDVKALEAKAIIWAIPKMYLYAYQIHYQQLVLLVHVRPAPILPLASNRTIYLMKKVT